MIPASYCIMVKQSFACIPPTVGPDSRYIYTPDLLEMETSVSRSLQTNHLFSAIATPIRLGAWKQNLVHHPDHDFARFIVRGIEEGFPIGVDPNASFMSARRNMSSATENLKVIEDYLTKEIAAGNIFSPFPPSILTEVHINRFGAIPKRYQLGKWLLITDLSYSEDASVNDAIDPSICSLTYNSVDEVAETAASLGQGALLAKIDMKSANDWCQCAQHREGGWGCSGRDWYAPIRPTLGPQGLQCSCRCAGMKCC